MSSNSPIERKGHNTTNQIVIQKSVLIDMTSRYLKVGWTHLNSATFFKPLLFKIN